MWKCLKGRELQHHKSRRAETKQITLCWSTMGHCQDGKTTSLQPHNPNWGVMKEQRMACNIPPVGRTPVLVWRLYEKFRSWRWECNKLCHLSNESQVLFIDSIIQNGFTSNPHFQQPAFACKISGIFSNKAVYIKTSVLQGSKLVRNMKTKTNCI